MNPLVGVTVPAYEAWNIQYATLTDKAASDFALCACVIAWETRSELLRRLGPRP